MKDEFSPKPFPPHTKEFVSGTKINGNILRGKRRREREIVAKQSCCNLWESTRQREQKSTLERERERDKERKRNRNGCNEESVRQSGPVAKTPSTHEHVQTHVPGILFRGGDVRSVLSLREGEERRWKEEALERERDLNPRDRVVLNTIDESANEDDKQREK